MLLSNMELLATAPGGVAKLRELILTLAVQGKLVPQDPNERAIDLNLVPELTSRLINEGKVPSSRAVAEVMELDEDHDQLPMNWSVIVANKILIPRSGNSKLIKGKLFDSNGEGLYAGYSASGQDVWLKTYEYEGTAVILSAVGARCGKAFLATGKWSAIANTHIVWPLEDVVLPAYGMLFLNDEKFWVRSGGAQPFVKVTETLAKSLWIPPLAEQSRIVTRVQELMRLCDALEAKGQLEAAQHAQLVSTLLGTLTASTTHEELAANWQRVAQHFDLLLDRPEAIDALEQTLLQLAVRGLLVPQDPADEPAFQLLQRLSNDSKRKAPSIRCGVDGPFGIPESWCWVNLEFLAESMSNGLYKPAKFYSESGTACVRMYNIQDGHLDFSKLMRLDVTPSELAQYRLEPGDLLINRVNSRELVGKCAVVSTHHEPLVYEAMNIRVRLLELVNMPSYVNLVLRTKRVREVFQGDAKQAVGQASINQTQVGGVAIPLPPLAEQSRIVTRVTALRHVCADLRQRLAERQSVQARLAEALVASVA